MPPARPEVSDFIYESFIDTVNGEFWDSSRILADCYADFVTTIQRQSRWNIELNEWLDKIKSESFEHNGEIGAVIMNCNPFTLGHYHLVEKALDAVDKLYIFVVEEDRSEFTFPEYFEKTEKVDSSNDIYCLGRH